MDYSKEIEELTLELQKKRKMPDYFINLFINATQSKKGHKEKRVGIIGDEFYSLYVRAFDLTPVLLNGGSFYLGENASHIFPQISDPVAKSTLGYLFSQEMDILKNLDALIVSASNDSYKKIIYYLKDFGIPIIQIEPPSFLLKKMPINYAFQQMKVLNEISKIKNSRLNLRKLKQELLHYKKAHQITTSEKWKALSTFIQDFFLQTLYLADKKDVWCSEIEKYLENVQAAPIEPLFLLMGSHIKFPSSKMYKIFSDIGINYFENQCLNLPEFHKIPIRRTSFFQLNECFKYQYTQSFTARTLSRDEQYNFTDKVKGIVYYLLKGQVSEAYEAELIEKIAIKHSIPYLCIETDYTNTDNEQIKIRIEAFYEMLKNKCA